METREKISELISCEQGPYGHFVYESLATFVSAAKRKANKEKDTSEITGVTSKADDEQQQQLIGHDEKEGDEQNDENVIPDAENWTLNINKWAKQMSPKQQFTYVLSLSFVFLWQQLLFNGMKV